MFHNLQAFHSQESDYYLGSYPTFHKDRNFYHTWKNFKQIKYETEKAYLIEILDKKQYWFPKSIIRQFKNNSMLIHSKIFYKIIGEYHDTAD